MFPSSGAARVSAQFLLVPSAGAEGNSFSYLLSLGDHLGEENKAETTGSGSPYASRGQRGTRLDCSCHCVHISLPARALVVEQCLGSVVTAANRLDCLLI